MRSRNSPDGPPSISEEAEKKPGSERSGSEPDLVCSDETTNNSADEPDHAEPEPEVTRTVTPEPEVPAQAPAQPLVKLRTFDDFVSIIAKNAARTCSLMTVDDTIQSLFDAAIHFTMEHGGDPFVLSCGKCGLWQRLCIPGKYWEDPSEIFLRSMTYHDDDDDVMQAARTVSVSFMDLVLMPYCGTMDLSAGRGAGPAQCPKCKLPLQFCNTIVDLLKEASFVQKVLGPEYVARAASEGRLLAVAPDRVKWKASTVCGCCGKANPPKKCSACNTVRYCDKKCQKEDWCPGPRHYGHKMACSFGRKHLLPYLMQKCLLNSEMIQLPGNWGELPQRLAQRQLQRQRLQRRKRGPTSIDESIVTTDGMGFVRVDCVSPSR